MDRNVSYTHIHIQTDKKINLNIDNLTSCNLAFIKMENWMKTRGILYFFSKSLKKVDDLGLLCVHINHSRRRIFSFKRILQTYRWVFTSLVWRQSSCIKPPSNCESRKHFKQLSEKKYRCRSLCNILTFRRG